MTTPLSIAAQIIERVTYVLVNLTLDLAPTNNRPETDTPDGFARHTDNTCSLDKVTDPGRLRLIQVLMETPSRGAFSMSTSTSSFEKVLRIRRGYPKEVFETIDGTEYTVDDLKQSDMEQIDRVVAGGILQNEIDTDHPAIPGVTLVRLEGEQDEFDGRVRSLLYGVNFERGYT